MVYYGIPIILIQTTILQINEDDDFLPKFLCMTEMNGVYMVDVFLLVEIPGSCKFVVKSLEDDFTKSKFS